MVKKNDFVILKFQTGDLEPNSVGIIRECLPNGTYKVFFIGKRFEINATQDDIEFIDLKKTGKPYEFKVCNVCHILKRDKDDFDVNQTDAQGRKTTRPSCKKCRVGIDGVALKASEKKRLDRNKPVLFFICPICEKGSIPGITANHVKDHDHYTGNAREWLCDSCNTGLGRFKDDIGLLQKAIEYLKYHNDNQKN